MKMKHKVRVIRLDQEDCTFLGEIDIVIQKLQLITFISGSVKLLKNRSVDQYTFSKHDREMG